MLRLSFRVTCDRSVRRHHITMLSFIFFNIKTTHTIVIIINNKISTVIESEHDGIVTTSYRKHLIISRKHYFFIN